MTHNFPEWQLKAGAQHALENLLKTMLEPGQGVQEKKRQEGN